MIRETGLILITLNDIIFWTFVVLDRLQPIMAVHGCITILKAHETKTSICTSIHTHFTRIPDSFPTYVAELIIENQNISALESTQLNNLPTLVNLTIKNSQVSVINPNSFLHVPQLISLRLSGNKICLKESSMPSRSLIYLKNIQQLDLSQNPLGFVPDYYFQFLKQLTFLNLSSAGNGFYIETNGLYGLTNLQILDLTNNSLHTLSESLLHSLSAMQLQEFYLYHNIWTCDCNLQWLKHWFLKHKLVKYSKELSKEVSVNGVTIIREIQPKCQSPYTLKGKNLLSDTKGSDSIRAVDLICPPKIFTQDRKVEIFKGHNVTFTCNFHANPGGLISWSKNGMVVLNHWRKVSWNQSQGVKFKAWLLLENVDEHDSGNWRCILTTKVSKVYATFTLKVLLSPSDIDFKSILKYVGIGGVTLILLLVVIGIIIYCVYGFKIHNINRENKASTNVMIDSKKSSLSQSQKNYHIISKPCKETGFDNKILVSQLDKSQYYNPVLIENNTSYIQPCIEQTHSPFSHYLINGLSSNCPFHGELAKKRSSKTEENIYSENKNVHFQDSMTDSTRSQSTSVPCPIHGNVLSYLSCPVSSAPATIHYPQSTCLSSCTVDNSEKEYVKQINSSNPAVDVSSDSFPKDIKYLFSSSPVTTFSFSTAI